MPLMLTILALTALALPMVELVAVGDVMPGRHVQRRFARIGGDYPFASVAPLLRRADLAFGNLECPLTARPFEAIKAIRLRAPESWAPRLRRAGFDILSLANNHALDCGPAGLADTRRALRRAGLAPLEGEPRDLLARGLRVRFLALADYAPQSVLSEETLRRKVSQARAGADVLVLSLHWGVEGSTVPSARQRRFARIAADAGATSCSGTDPTCFSRSSESGGRSSPTPWGTSSSTA